MTYLNLGCGQRFHAEWINVDFSSTEKGVLAHDLTQGIPFPDESLEVVYHSHLLEHFPRSLAENFLGECYRVLRPQGVIRVVVPDLEKIARTYLMALEKASSGSKEWAENYNWITLEMFDQTVRNQSGGEMLTYLSEGTVSNKEFVIQRIGTEAKKLIAVGRQAQSKLTESFLECLLKRAYLFLHDPAYRREVSLKLLLHYPEYEALQVGRFRRSGEVHQWMYDRYSLSSLLKRCGFHKVVQQKAVTSYTPNWADFNLDTEMDCTVYKPDSIFMEAIKPSS
jgi:predicted SAM-dependent methyltransferase